MLLKWLILLSNWLRFCALSASLRSRKQTLFRMVHNLRYVIKRYKCVLMIGNYKTMIQSQQSDQFLPPSQGIGMHVDVRDPNDKMVLSRTYSAQGQFTFISHTAGEHVICLYSNTSKWFGGAKLRVYLDIQVLFFYFCLFLGKNLCFSKASVFSLMPLIVQLISKRNRAQRNS